MRHGVVDEQPVLEVLAGVGEVEAEHLDVAAGRGEPRLRGDPHDVAAEGHDDALERGVAADLDRLLRQVHGVVGPVVDADHGERGAVADDELDVVGVGRAAGVVEHDDGLGERLDVDEQVAEGSPSPPSPRSVTTVGPAGDGLAWDRDHGGLLERRPGARGDPVGRHAGAAEPRVVAADGLDLDLGCGVDLDATPCRRRRPSSSCRWRRRSQRGEPPLLLAARRARRSRRASNDVMPLAAAVAGHRRRAVRVRLAAEPAGLRARGSAARLAGSRIRWRAVFVELNPRPLPSAARSAG